jgi:hypothetical protein
MNNLHFAEDVLQPFAQVFYLQEDQTGGRTVCRHVDNSRGNNQRVMMQRSSHSASRDSLIPLSRPTSHPLISYFDEVA